MVFASQVLPQRHKGREIIRFVFFYPQIFKIKTVFTPHAGLRRGTARLK